MKKKDKYEILSDVWLAAMFVAPDFWPRIGAGVIALVYLLSMIFCEEEA